MKTILIAIGNPHIRFSNNQSAVVSYLLTFKNHLEQKGYKVLLSDLVLQKHNSEVKNKNSSTIKSIVKNFFPKLYRKLADKKLVQQIDSLTKELLQECKPDLVIEFLDYYSQIAYEFKRHQNTPYILIFDAPILQKYFDIYGHKPLKYKILVDREANSLNEADQIICYSEPVWKYINKHFKTGASHQILPTIVWERMTEKTQTTINEKITLGFIGSFLKWHYVDVLVKVFNQLANKFQNINLLLIGYGEEWERVQSQISKLEHKDRIVQTGFVSDDEMEKLKNQFDIGVMAGSNWYGSPLKIFEYAMLNIPVVGPDSPTVLDLFDKDKELLIVDSESPESTLYAHLESLITDPQLRKQLADALRTKVENRYSKKYYFSCFDNIIEASLSNH